MAWIATALTRLAKTDQHRFDAGKERTALEALFITNKKGGFADEPSSLLKNPTLAD